MSSEKIKTQSGGRSEATRERMIEAALELFGAKGYEGVGAREITAKAGVPLSAIPYHFGTKAALYEAVLMRVREEMARAIAPAIPAALAALEGPSDDAKKALRQFQAALLDAIAFSSQSQVWAKLLLREHLDPSPAFDIVYNDAAKDAVDMAAALIAHATQRSVEDEAVVIEAFACVGEVLVFRTAQLALTKRLGWSKIGPHEAARICEQFSKMD